MANIKVLIADDHDLIRQGIKRIIDMEDDVSVIGEATNGNDLMVMIRDYKPDVVVTDMHMPNFDGVELIKALKENHGDQKIIVVSMEASKEVVERAIELGVEGYLLKESAGSDVVDAIRRVYMGDGYIDKSLVSILMKKVKSKSQNNSVFDSLTGREKDILYYLSKGYGNKEIAAELFLSEKTIKNYSTKIFKKLEVKDRVHAALLAVKHDFGSYYQPS